MANVLLLDHSEVAGRAMAGILARGNHRCVVAGNTGEAWDRLWELVRIDLLFLELRLQSENAMFFIQRLRADGIFKRLPVVVYTNVEDHDSIKKALALGVQNYLIKPYNDDHVYREIAKACANPWLNLHFEEEKSFCAQMGLRPDKLRQLRQELMTGLERAAALFPAFAEKQDRFGALAQITALSGAAEAAGVWAVVELLQELQGKAEAGNWAAFMQRKDDFEHAARLLYCYLNPAHVPDGLLTESEREARLEAEQRELWLGRDVKRLGLIVGRQEVEKLLDSLPGCPVMDTVAAAFQMATEKRAAGLSQVMEIVAEDTGLTAQVLVAANRLEREERTPIEDPRTAITLLGDVRLSTLAKALPLVPERRLQFPPITWAHFRMFQAGVARLARYVCTHLEYRALAANAYTAGLLHDVGKLLLLKLYPFAFQAIAGYARHEGALLAEAEQKYIGITTRELGERFARKSGLPLPFCNVIRWVETPESAAEDVELVAIVSLARDVCLHNHVGYCGDTPKDFCPPIEETAAWRVLQGRVFPSFDLGKFEALAHAYCKELKLELSGRRLDAAQ